MRRHTCVYHSVPVEIFLQNAATEDRDRTRIESTVYVFCLTFYTQRHHLPVFCFSFDGATLGFVSKYGCWEVKHQNLFSQSSDKKSTFVFTLTEMKCIVLRRTHSFVLIVFFFILSSQPSLSDLHTQHFPELCREMSITASVDLTNA